MNGSKSIPGSKNQKPEPNHTQCLLSEHIFCKVCHGLICLYGCSDHRADMYRLTPVHPACR